MKMRIKLSGALFCSLLALLVSQPFADAENFRCDGVVVDATPGSPTDDPEVPADFFIVTEGRLEASPADVFEIFRPIMIRESKREHQLWSFIGRLRVIDIQGAALVGRLVEFAPRLEHPRVRYETVMLGDCLVRVISEEPPKAMEEVIPEISPPPLRPGPAVSIDRRVIPSKILFAFDSAELQEKWRDELRQLARFIEAHQPTTVVVEGHADWIGSDAYNVNLSRRRAQAVVDYLVTRHGLARGLFLIEPYGESRPEASNLTAEGRQRNRRVKLSVLKEVVPTTDTVFVPEAEWPLAVGFERLVPEESELPLIPATAEPLLEEP